MQIDTHFGTTVVAASRSTRMVVLAFALRGGPQRPSDMKLFLCSECGEVFSLGLTHRACAGGHGGGMYLTDGVTAMVWGPRDATFVLALGNAALDAAIQEQIAHGDTRRKVLLPYGVEPQGRALHAWII